jgi:E3 ubiquitin-protein ligase DOA10
MFFIRDPHDPSYAPVKDIIERPARGQIRKVSGARSHGTR